MRDALKFISRILMLLGIGISLYLVVNEPTSSSAGTLLYCPAPLGVNSTLINCAKVLSSNYATIFGVPLALISLVWFAMVFALSWFGKAGTYFALTGIFGLIYSPIAMFLIGSICTYCLVLDLILIPLISISAYRVIKRKKKRSGTETIGS